MSKKVVAYIRTNDDYEHIDSQYSHEKQLDMITKYAGNKNYDVEHIFYDAQTNQNTKIKDRYEFNHMIEFMNKNNIDTIIIESAGRISRDTLIQLGIKDYLSEFPKKTIECVDFPDFYKESNPAMAFAFNVQIGLLEYQESIGFNKYR